MKKLLFAFAAMFLLLAACNDEAKITLNPQKDAQTYFKFFEVDDMEGGQAYLAGTTSWTAFSSVSIPQIR